MDLKPIIYNAQHFAVKMVLKHVTNRLTIIVFIYVLAIVLSKPVDSKWCVENCSCYNSTKTAHCFAQQTIPVIKDFETQSLSIEDSNMYTITNDIFEQTKNDRFKALILKNCQIVFIEKYAFRSLVNLSVIDLSSNTLAEIDVRLFETNFKLTNLSFSRNYELMKLIGGPFPSLVELLELSFYHCKLSELDPNIFSELVSLESVNLARNHFVQIDVNLFKKNTKLKELRLDFNPNMIRLTGGPFPSLPQLTFLDLSWCNFSYLGKNTFLELVSLKHLNIKFNNFVEIDVSMFRKNIKLTALLLGGNENLNKLDEMPFPKLPQLEDLDLSDLNLSKVENDTFQELPSLKRLYLHNNQFLEINVNVFKTNRKLKYLRMQENSHLTKLTGGPFPSLPLLNLLNLRNCNLSEFEQNLFINLENLQVLYISGNKFKSVPNNIFNSFNNLTKLTLSRNPWNCNCGLRNLWQFYDTNIKGLMRSSENEYVPICSEPARLSNLRWESLTYKDFDCNSGSVVINPTEHHTATIVISISTVLGLGICIIGAFAYFKIREISQTGLSPQEIKLFKIGNPKMQRGNDILNSIESMPFNSIYEIHRSRFTWDPTQILGKGTFGIVYKGTYISKTVAIKTVHTLNGSSDSIKYIRSLLSEIKVMCYLDSKDDQSEDHVGKLNIIKLIGANTTNINKGLLLISEFCEQGSLESYLRKHREHFQSIPVYCGTSTEAADSNPEEICISTADLVKWAYQIANGMTYISSRNIIHADLASRNVLLTNERIAKIADFGLSRRLYEYATYTKNNQEPLPWRWMAIESLKDLTFSTASDIWSYGVTLWEIFSLAQVPYPGLNWSHDFIEALENGLRPNQPKHATTNLHNLMEKTWITNPTQRPKFDEIRTSLRNILEEYTGQIYETILPVVDDTVT